MFRRSVMVLGVLSFLLSFVGHGAWGGVQYTVTDLGTLSGGSLSAASGINAIGQVVGASYTSSGLYHAFLYSNGAMTDLGTLGGTWSGVGDINASGQVVGGAVTNGGDYHAFLYSNATMADLNTLASNLGGWILNGAGGINASGQVCGVMSSVIDDEVVHHGYLYSGGTITDLGPQVLPVGINDSEDVLAGAGLQQGEVHHDKRSRLQH